MSNKENQSTYIDRPEVTETLVDRLGRSVYHDRLLRLEALALRSRSAPGAGGNKVVQEVPVARLVLTVPAILELHGYLVGLIEELKRRGELKEIEPPSGTRQ